jgi:hypothetical protein
MRTSIVTSLMATMSVLAGLAPGGVAAGQPEAHSGLPLDFHPVAISAAGATDVWLAGRPSYAPSPAMFEHWDGTRWRRSPLPDFSESIVNDVVAVGSGNAWAVGRFDADRILHWDGTGWRPVEVPGLPKSAVLVSVTAAGPSDVWAVGQRDIGSLWKSLAVHWDGTAWAVVRTWRPPADVHTDYEAVSVGAPDDVWASGFRYDSASGEGKSIVDHWDGRRWRRVHGLDDVVSEGVTDLTTVSPTDVWVVGSRSVAGGEVPMTEHWDGSTWTLEATPTPGINSGIERISAVSSSDVWAAGWILTGRRHRTTFEPLALHWDGSTWSQFPVAGGSARRSVATGVSAVSGTDAWLSGSSGRRPIVRHWDGSAWS